MHFADLKNDFVFRRVFASPTHPDILRGLLNDLLDRRDERAIVSFERLPTERLPRAKGAALSILDVRCKDQAGTTFVVAMQLIHHPGFIKRVVRCACAPPVGDPETGGRSANLADVVVISVCNFEIWPDAEQEKQTLPPVPMLSRWNTVEEAAGNRGFVQVQYAFLELPKVPKETPAPGAAYWAWLFVHASELDAVPADLPPGPCRAALELANQATFTQLELDAYEKVDAEIMQVFEIAEAAFAEGKAEGYLSARSDTLVRLLGRAGIALRDEDRARIQACRDAAQLDRWVVNVPGAKAIADVLT
jgi:hypothetical protein